MRAVARLADTDGDGYDDLLAGACKVDGVTDDRGALSVLLAGPRGVISADRAEAARWCEAPQGTLGRAVAAAGDAAAGAPRVELAAP